MNPHSRLSVSILTILGVFVKSPPIKLALFLHHTDLKAFLVRWQTRSRLTWNVHELHVHTQPIFIRFIFATLVDRRGDGKRRNSQGWSPRLNCKWWIQSFSVVADKLIWCQHDSNFWCMVRSVITVLRRYALRQVTMLCVIHLCTTISLWKNWTSQLECITSAPHRVQM